MTGRRALVYSRIRENRLNPAENDLTRGERQQAMLRAIGGELTSFRTLVKMPVLADDIVAPLATDLSAAELTQLAWVNYRAGQTRRRLGGTPTSIGGESALVPVEENRNVVLMFLGVSAPQPPPPQYGLFGPGCVVR